MIAWNHEIDVNSVCILNMDRWSKLKIIGLMWTAAKQIADKQMVEKSVGMTLYPFRTDYFYPSDLGDKYTSEK